MLYDTQYTFCLRFLILFGVVNLRSTHSTGKGVHVLTHTVVKHSVLLFITYMYISLLLLSILSYMKIQQPLQITRRRTLQMCNNRTTHIIYVVEL